MAVSTVEDEENNYHSVQRIWNYGAFSQTEGEGMKTGKKEKELTYCAWTFTYNGEQWGKRYVNMTVNKVAKSMTEDIQKTITIINRMNALPKKGTK